MPSNRAVPNLLVASTGVHEWYNYTFMHRDCFVANQRVFDNTYPPIRAPTTALEESDTDEQSAHKEPERAHAPVVPKLGPLRSKGRYRPTRVTVSMDWALHSSINRPCFLAMSVSISPDSTNRPCSMT